MPPAGNLWLVGVRALVVASRRWNSWHRFTALALVALAVLTICAADSHDHNDDPSRQP